MFGFTTSSLQKSFGDKIEEIAGDVIEQNQIRECLEGRTYWVFDEEVDELYLPAIDPQEYAYYYNIWDTWDAFRILPNGRGTNHEQPKLIEILKQFIRTYEITKNAIEAEAYKRARSK